VVARISKAIGITTNNRAEYLSLIAGLERGAETGCGERGARNGLRARREATYRQIPGKKSSVKAAIYRGLPASQEISVLKHTAHTPGA